MVERENPSIEQFQEQVRTELEEVIKIWSPTNIRSFVQAKLEGKAFEITMGALGFRHSFDRWEVNHRDSSPAMRAILDDAQEEIVSWIGKQIEILPNLSKRTLNSLQSEYKEALYQNLRKAMQERARTEAERLADQLCVGLFDGDQIARETNMP